MPRVPVAERSQTTAPIATPRASAEAFGSAIGRGLGDIAVSIDKVAQERAQEEERFRRFDAKRKFTEFANRERRILLESEAEISPGGEGFEEGFLEGYDKRAQEFLGTIDPKLSAEYSLSTSDLRSDMSISAYQTQIRERLRFYDDIARRTIGEISQNVMANPSSYGNAYQAMLAMVNATGLPVEQRAELIADAELSLLNAGVQGYIDAGEWKAGKAFVKQRAAEIGLDAEKVSGLIDRIERSRDRAVAQAEKYTEKEQDKIRKQGFYLLRKGELDDSWLEANRPYLTVTNYADLSRALIRGENSTNDVLYVDLLRESLDRPDLALERAYEAVKSGYLKGTDYDKIESSARRTVKDDEEGRPWVKEVRQEVMRFLAPDNQKDNQGFRRLEALAVFDDFIEKNPQATRRDLINESQKISEEFRKIGRNDEIAKLPELMFVDGIGKFGYTIQILDRAQESLVRALENGTIDRKTAAEQQSLQEQWRKLLEK